jgi:hypothetical protein
MMFTCHSLITWSLIIIIVVYLSHISNHDKRTARGRDPQPYWGHLWLCDKMCTECTVRDDVSAVARLMFRLLWRNWARASVASALGQGCMKQSSKGLNVLGWLQNGGPKPLRMIWRVSPSRWSTIPWCLVDVGWPFHDTSLGSKSICFGSIHVETGLLCVIFEWFLLFLLKLLNDR